MPKNVIARVCDKSTWARKGLQVFNTVIEPGWEGYLTLELVNHSWWFISLREGDPIAQILFEYTDKECIEYIGKYQHQANEPVKAIMEKNN